jgi:hypothetical protein
LNLLPARAPAGATIAEFFFIKLQKSEKKTMKMQENHFRLVSETSGKII